MDYKVNITEAAAEDLRGILWYISDSLANPAAAMALADEVEACYARLREVPMMYELCRDERLREKGYRKVVIKNYILVYHPDPEAQTVTVLRFFYGRRLYERLL